MLKRVAYTFAILVAVILVVGLLLPASAHVERRIVIRATSEAVYPYLSDFRKFNQWQPWAKIDPGTRFEYTGDESGVGARMTWYGSNPAVNSGSQQIILAEPPRKVVSQLEFGEGTIATSTFTLEADGGNTVITWAYDTEFGYDILARYFGLLLDSWIGRDYEQGLRDLKALVESGAQ